MFRAVCTVFFGFSVFLAGCSTTLKVYDEAGEEVNGIPIRTPEVYVMRGEYTTNSKIGKNCEPTPFVQTVSLPTGALHYVNAYPKVLASSEFNVNFSDSGVLQSIAVNSQPAANDFIDSAAGFATEVLFPVIGIGDSDSASEPETRGLFTNNSRNSGRVACDTGAKVSPDNFTPLVQQ